ncbi:hypothetical protein [Persephonella sp.]
MEILIFIFLILGIAYFIGGEKAARITGKIILFIMLIPILLIVAAGLEAKNPGIISGMIITAILAPSILYLRDWLRERKKSKKAKTVS